MNKQQLTQRNARQHRAHLTRTVHLQRHDLSTVLLHCPITNMMRTLSIVRECSYSFELLHLSPQTPCFIDMWYQSEPILSLKGISVLTQVVVVPWDYLIPKIRICTRKLTACENRGLFITKRFSQLTDFQNNDFFIRFWRTEIALDSPSGIKLYPFFYRVC